MNREELLTRLPEKVGDNRQQLTREKIENRAFNIRETNSYLLFDIERHPGKGDHPPGHPDTTLQTWRYDEEKSQLERVCEFARSHMDKLEQNEVGEPVCRNCGSVLDLHGDVFGFVWRCDECDAIGGKEKEITEPSIGEPLISARHQKQEAGFWVLLDEDVN